RRPEPRAAMEWLGWRRAPARRILALVMLEVRQGRRLLRGRHYERPGPAEPHDLRRDPDRVQHEPTFLAGAAPERAEDLDDFGGNGGVHVGEWKAVRRGRAAGRRRCRAG